MMQRLAQAAEGLAASSTQPAAAEELPRTLMVLCHLAASQPQLSRLPLKAAEVCVSKPPSCMLRVCIVLEDCDCHLRCLCGA